MKIVMLERESLGEDVDVSCFRQFGELIEYPVTAQEQVPERVGDADVIIVNKLRMDKSSLDSCPNVKLILETATGIDNDDVEYLRSRQIALCNVKGYSTPAVAQHTFAMYFYLAEHLPKYDDFVKSGAYGAQKGFSKFDWSFRELQGKTWGIIGLGEIGRAVAKIAEAFGCTVVYYSASGRSYDVPYQRLELEEFLASSDVVSIHAPLNDHTRGLINLDNLKKMKPTAYLINVGRGPIVCEADLLTALEEGIIAGAGLDVLSAEPIRKDNPLNGFTDSDRLFITPHMAWGSVESRERMISEMMENARAYVEGRERNRIC